MKSVRRQFRPACFLIALVSIFLCLNSPAQQFVQDAKDSAAKAKDAVKKTAAKTEDAVKNTAHKAADATKSSAQKAQKLAANLSDKTTAVAKNVAAKTKEGAQKVEHAVTNVVGEIRQKMK
jgi:hypothetical protein